MANNEFQATVYLLRHGEIERPGILAGRTDVELSANGYQQLNDAGNKIINALKLEDKKLEGKKLEDTELESTALESTGLVHCFSSPLKRCQHWAQDFCQTHNLSLEIAENIREMDFGDWDGQSYQNLWQAGNASAATSTTSSTATSIGDFWQDPWQHTAPNGETMSQFTARVDSWWQQFLAKKLAEPSVIVCHGGVIKHLLARILNMPIETAHHLSAIDVPYAGVIKVSIYYDNAGVAYPKVCF